VRKPFGSRAAASARKCPFRPLGASPVHLTPGTRLARHAAARAGQLTPGTRPASRTPPRTRSRAGAGFDYFAIGVPSKEAIEDLAARLTALGEPHAGVHFATIGWILPQLHDPDGHEVRFYTTTHHSEPPSQGVVRIENPRETAEAAERAMQDGRR
jgi:hypothetical protein